MNRIAIIAAMPGELKPLVANSARNWRYERTGPVHLWRGEFAGGQWIAACSGAGAAAAARAFAAAEQDGPVTAAVSVGWAGALNGELVPGRAYRVSEVIDAQTGERFSTAPFAPDASGNCSRRAAEQSESEGVLLEAERFDVLKGHDFSRAITPAKSTGPSGPEGCFTANSSEDRPSMVASSAPEAVSLVTSSRVADAAEKRRLAATYGAGMVDMEAAAVARLAAMRGISFDCIKGISDGFSEQLPDLNRFMSSQGHFHLGRFILFVLLRPRYWPALIRMGENSKKASSDIAKLLLDCFE